MSSFDYRSLWSKNEKPGDTTAADNNAAAATSTTNAANNTIDYGDTDDEGICCKYCLPELSWRERLLGCAACMIAGYLLSFGSFFRIKDLLLGNSLPFVYYATVGNIIALTGSFFLKGPKTQLRHMFDDTRRIATIVYLVSMALTLTVAFSPVWGPKSFYLILLMVCQWLAVAWYCLSYIPYAREAIRGYMSRTIASV